MAIMAAIWEVTLLKRVWQGSYFKVKQTSNAGPGLVRLWNTNAHTSTHTHTHPMLLWKRPLTLQTSLFLSLNRGSQGLFRSIAWLWEDEKTTGTIQTTWDEESAETGTDQCFRTQIKNKWVRPLSHDTNWIQTKAHQQRPGRRWDCSAYVTRNRI